jgi:hypothetical protein
VKKVWAPHLNRHVILGACKQRDQHAPMLKLRDYTVRGSLPAAPAVVDYSEKAMPVLTDVEGNENAGDCVQAEDAHYIAVITGNANGLYAYTKEQTLADYSAITGFNPADPNTDQGTDPIANMNYRVQKGYADGSKDLGYLRVDTTNKTEVQFALWAFGNLKIWLALPDSYINPFPSNGAVWGVGTPDFSNGHCIGTCSANSPRIVGVNCDGVQVVTWGLILTMTWSALAALCTPAQGGGCATRVNKDWLISGISKTPSGFAWDDLIQDFDTMGGSIPIPVAPPTPPVVTPPVATTPPTLAQAQGAVQAAIMQEQFPLLTQQRAIDDATAGLAALTGWPS